QFGKRRRQAEARMKTEFCKIGGEARLGAGDAEIGGNRQYQSAADGSAMDGGDDRLLVAEDAHGLNVEMVDRQVRRRILLRARFLLLPLRVGEIGAGAERLALGCEHRGADFDVLVELFQRIRNLVYQGDVEEVEGRLSDFDQADMAVLLDADIRVLGHWVSSLNSRKPARALRASKARGR